MNADSIDYICRKFGTTLGNLIPQVIKYGTHKSAIQLVLGITFLIIGIFCIVILLKHFKSSYDDWSEIVLLFGGLIFTFLGLGLVIDAAFSLHMWSYSPGVKAYETIFGWIGGES